MKILAIIAAAGNQARWDNFHNTKKQLVRFSGEPLIHRTQRQLWENGIRDIKILGTDPRFVTSYSKLHVPDKPSALVGTAIGHSVQAWDDDKHILIMMGDVLWDDDVVRQMANLDGKEIIFIGHGKASDDHNPELFAVFVPQDRQDEFRNVIEFVRLHEVHRVSAGWQCYRHLHGLDLAKNCVTDGFIEAPPTTIDFDRPHDYLEAVSRERKKRRANK